MPAMNFLYRSSVLLICLCTTLFFGCSTNTVNTVNHSSVSAAQLASHHHQTTQTIHATKLTDSHSDVSCTALSMQSATLGHVNRIRATGALCGSVYYPPAEPLRWSNKLQQAAAVHSQDMAMHNFFNHKSATNGTTLPERLRGVGYRYKSAGENIGAGPNTVAQVIEMWIASPGHCVTLMTANFVDLGASCKNNSNSYYKTYWTLKAAMPG
jgi:uncharacterized protein YkwD